MTISSVHRYNYSGQRGFTLIELLVVLVVLSLAAGIAAPALFEANERGRLEAATAQVYNDLRRARSLAAATGAPVSLDVRRAVKDRAIAVENVQPLVFYPDGGAASARFTLTLGAQRRTLAVDWLTGHAALAE